jgi:hypothetical protein
VEPLREGGGSAERTKFIPKTAFVKVLARLVVVQFEMGLTKLCFITTSLASPIAVSSGKLPFHLANAPRARSAFFFLRVIVQEVILSTTPDTGRLMQEKSKQISQLGLACSG